MYSLTAIKRATVLHQMVARYSGVHLPSGCGNPKQQTTTDCA
jgi:hypothetical protein